jgi:hypothetical protein
VASRHFSTHSVDQSGDRRQVNAVGRTASLQKEADLANADANNGPGRARMPLESIMAHIRYEQATPTIVDDPGQP